jgi:hypothetical protein
MLGIHPSLQNIVKHYQAGHPNQPGFMLEPDHPSKDFLRHGWGFFGLAGGNATEAGKESINFQLCMCFLINL